jgi:hypothetical protein
MTGGNAFRSSSNHLVRLQHSILVAQFEHTLLNWHQCLMSMDAGNESSKETSLFAVMAETANLKTLRS